MSFQEELREIFKKAEEDFIKVSSLEELEKIRVNYLGRKSYLANFSEVLKKLEKEEKKEIGRLFNQVKEKIENLYSKKKEEILEKEIEFDFYHPGKEISFPSLNLVSFSIRKIVEIFINLGFKVASAPEIVTEYENFDSLNIPEFHPARDMWSTLWLEKPEKYLLRTHTSAFQVPFLKKFKPPIRGVIPGKVYRFEATDARHDFEFHQIEGLSVSEDSNLSHMIYIFEVFFKEYFEKNIEIKLRPSYFPFTEPSVEIDITCLLCNKKGCEVCKGTGWLEVAGAGMIHPFVLQQAGIDTKKYQGYAFGTGVERLIMLKYEINDIRILHSPDLRTNEI